MRTKTRRLWLRAGVSGSLVVTPGTVNYSTLGFVDGDPLIVAGGTTVLMDIPSVKHSAISISGAVKAIPGVVSRLWGNGIQIAAGGLLQIGNTATPFDSSATFEVVLDGARPTVSGNSGGGALVTGFTHIGNTATGNNGTTNDNYGASRGLIVNVGGTLSIVGAAPTAAVRTKLSQNYIAGSGNVIHLVDPVTVNAGDPVWLSNCNYWDGVNHTEVLTVAASVVNSTTVTLTTAPAYSRWGLLQYATDQGISLTPDSWTDGGTSLYTASASGTTLNVTAASGTISVGQWLDVAGVKPWTYYVIAFGTGTGGVGTYVLSSAVTFASSNAVKLQGMRGSSTQEQTIDQRTFVVFPKRNVVFRPATDAETGTSALATYGFGAHMMAMDNASQSTFMHVENCWFKNFGQRGLQGRYGIHWHLTHVNPGTGATYPPYTNGQGVVRHCSFDTGNNRAVTIHGGMGVVSEYNDAYRSLGHTFFLENGSEQYNTSQYNVALTATDPGVGNRLKVHDGQASGHWHSNLNNTLVGNWGIDCVGFGWWNAISQGLSTRSGEQYGCLGESALCPIAPFYGQQILWDGCGGMGNGTGGGSSDSAPADNQGNLTSGKFYTTLDGLYANLNVAGNQVPSTFSNARQFKNIAGGYFNRVQNPLYQNWQMVDHGANGFQGATVFGQCNNPLMVARSLNTLDGVTVAHANAFATYHFSVGFANVSAYEYSAQDPFVNSGHSNMLSAQAVMEAWDLYLHPIDCGMSKNVNWKLFNSVPIWKTPSANILSPLYDSYNTDPYNRSENYNPTMVAGNPFIVRAWQLSSAIYDPNGLMTQGVKNSWLTANIPFLTTENTFVPVGTNHGFELMAAVSVAQFYGLVPQGQGYPYFDILPITFQRVDASGADISGATFALSNSSNNNSGQPAGQTGAGFGNPLFSFHGAAAPKGSRVRLYDHINNTVYGSTAVWLSVYNCTRADDYIDIGIPWSASVNPSSVTYQPVATAFSSVASWAALQAFTNTSGNGVGAYWRDTANNRLWVRCVGYVSTYPYGSYFDTEVNAGFSKLIVSP